MDSASIDTSRPSGVLDRLATRNGGLRSCTPGEWDIW